MKKKNIVYLANVFAVASCILSGCHYLDLDEETTSLTEEQVFSTYTGARSFLDGALSGMSYTYPFRINNIFIYGGSLIAQTDAADTGNPNYPSTSEFKRCNLSESVLERYSYIDGSATTGGDYQMSKNLWKTIRKANKAIENFELMKDGTEIQRNEYLGEAYFIRGMAHFSMCRFFGGLPYIDHALLADESWDLPRGTAYDTYVRAADDLYQAYEYLNAANYMRRNNPTNLNPGTSILQRPSGCIALAIRARALMYAASPLNNQKGIEDWHNAADACAQALSVALENGYTLVPIENYSELFHTVSTTNETIWPDIRSMTNNDKAITSVIPYILSKGASSASMTGTGTHPTQNFVDRFETIDGRPLQTAQQRAEAVAAGSYNEQLPYVNRDPRLELNIIHDGSKPFDKALITSAGGCFNIHYDPTSNSWPRTTLNGLNISFGVNWDSNVTASEGYTNTGYYLRKYFDGSHGSSHPIVDPMVRLAELYLNYAECVNEAYGPSGKVTAYDNVNITALEAVNVIRSRAKMPDVRTEYVGSADTFRERIHNERCVELAYESNHYWFDIRRWKTAPELMKTRLQGMYVESCTPDEAHPSGKVYQRRDLAENRQGTWKDCMYVLPFSRSEEITMVNFVNNAPWR